MWDAVSPPVARVYYPIHYHQSSLIISTSDLQLELYTPTGSVFSVLVPLHTGLHVVCKLRRSVKQHYNRHTHCGADGDGAQ